MEHINTPIKKIETRKNIINSKWAFLNYDNQGHTLSREQKLQHAVNYFNTKILPELKKDPFLKDKIERKHTLGVNDVLSKGYNGFLRALSKDCKTKRSELKDTLGFIHVKSPSQDDKHRFLNYDIKNIHLTQEQKLKVSIKFYNSNVLPELKTKPEIRKKNAKRDKIGKKEKIFPTLQLFNDLKQELLVLLPKKDLSSEEKLTDKNLSYYLGQNENHITYIKKNYKRNPRFQLSLDLFGGYKESLSSKFGDRCKNAINLIDSYEKINPLKNEIKHILNYHPNIRLDYFKDINTKEKAYWLDFSMQMVVYPITLPKRNLLGFILG